MEVPVLSMCRVLWACTVTIGLSFPAIAVSADSLDSITVQAQRDREKLKHEVDTFVSSVIYPLLIMVTRSDVGRARLSFGRWFKQRAGGVCSRTRCILPHDVATDSMVRWTRIRKASRARAGSPNSPSDGEAPSVLRYAVRPPSIRYFPVRCSICQRKLAAKRSFFARQKSNCVISVGDMK